MCIFSDVNFIPPTWEEFEENAKPVLAESKKTVNAGDLDKGVGRGRGDQSGRGRPGRGGGSGRGGKSHQAPRDEQEEVGKIPKNYRVCKDRNGRDICIRFQTGACNNGVDGICGKGSRMRMHVCATIKSTSKLTLCQSSEHAHKDCPDKVE